MTETLKFINVKFVGKWVDILSIHKPSIDYKKRNESQTVYDKIRYDMI